MNTDIFKAYDIRGKVGDELNVEVIKNIGRAMADWLPNDGPVAVGRDMRPDSADFAEAMIAGLTEQGREVWDLGMIATDMIYFAVGNNKLAGGAVITASHNPGEYNGIKLCREEAKPIGENSGLFEIRDNIVANKFKPAAKVAAKAMSKDVVDGWIDHVMTFIDPSRLGPLNIAVDAGNGMAGVIFAELEPYVPWQVTEMYFEPDGTFPNHEANPLKFETLTDLIKEIKTNKLDGGIAFDGDGDRAFLVDETGEVLTGGVMSAMLAEYFLSKNKGATIIYDARNSRIVPEIIEKKGGKAVITRVGHSNIKQAMSETNSPFGVEASGHYYFKDHWFADSGLIAAVIGLYVATINRKSLSYMRKKYTKYAAIPETNFVVKDKQAAIDAVAKAFPEAKQDHLDGLTLTFKDGWLNVRPSNTEPLLRLNAEATSQNLLESRIAKVELFLI